MMKSYTCHAILAAILLTNQANVSAAYVYGVRGGASSPPSSSPSLPSTLQSNNTRNKNGYGYAARSMVYRMERGGGRSTRTARRKRSTKRNYANPRFTPLSPPANKDSEVLRKWRVDELADPSYAESSTAADMPISRPYLLRTESGVSVLSAPRPSLAIESQATSPRRPSTRKLAIPKVDALLAMVYFCNAFAVTLPVVLTPIIGSQLFQLSSSSQLTSFCATVASVAIAGGGVGKLINGIVCQKMGGVATASNYLTGLGACSFALSLASTTSIIPVPYMVAGMEFFSSALWVASSLILSNHYAKQPLLFARGVTFLSLSSTLGQLLSKLVGGALLQVTDWRNVAKLGGVLSMLGALTVKFILSKEVKPEPVAANTSRGIGFGSRPSNIGIVDKIKAVVSNRLFWVVSLAHVSGYLARTCDKMMAPFIRELTAFPLQVCGSLTASVTLGFAYGVMKAQSFYKADSVPEKTRILKRWYSQAVLSLVGLGLCANETFRGALSLGPNALAALVVLISGFFSSSVAFQFFQIPNMVSSVEFAENKAICLAFLDGVAFFLTAPLWAYSSRIVERAGWSAAWGILAVVFGLGGSLMLHALKPVIAKHDKQTG